MWALIVVLCLQVIQMTTTELDAAVASRRKAAAQRQKELARDEAAAAEAEAELEEVARERWWELEQELEAAAADPKQPAPRFRRGSGGGGDVGVTPHAGTCSAEEPAVYFKPDVGDEVKFGERADSPVKTIERGTRPRAAAAAARPGRRAAPGRCCE